MNDSLSERVLRDMIALAQKYDIKKLILFGSRARGDHRERSDIDLAVSGGNTTEFSFAVNEELWTLLMFDVVNLDEPVRKELLSEIERDGVVLYEKV